ncbi:hypothetical protein [Actinacidiphila soli]|uniref:hypothetical protein n=1 Tax=Actinacidiphila soli TaxID=2487275 RepID=UPI000FCAC21C|nr:hypothetical protein [Actinacidiphila soli]
MRHSIASAAVAAVAAVTAVAVGADISVSDTTPQVGDTVTVTYVLDAPLAILQSRHPGGPDHAHREGPARRGPD